MYHRFPPESQKETIFALRLSQSINPLSYKFTTKGKIIISYENLSVLLHEERLSVIIC